MFCPKCGKEGKGICAECYLEDHPLGFKEAEVLLCKCKSYRYKGLWLKDLDDSLQALAEKNLQLPEDVKVQDVRVIPEYKKNRIELDIWVRGDFRGETFEKNLKGTVKVTNTTCPECSKVNANAYEAILQLRSEKKPEELEVAIARKYVSDIKKVRGGHDFYLTSGQYGKQLEKEFIDAGYDVKTSTKIYGRRDGRDIYRVSISVREAPFKVGDFLSGRRKILEVLKVGKNSSCKDLETGKQKIIDSGKLRGYEKVACQEDLTEAVVTMVSPDVIQILDLSDNKTYELKKKREDLAAGQEIMILKLGDRIYIP